MSGKFKYLPGDKIGPLQMELLERTRKDKNNSWFGLFKCPLCGEIYETRIHTVAQGKSKSCGCSHKKHCIEIGHKNAIDITGKRSGRLVADHWTGKTDSYGNRIWACKCDCGNPNFKEVTTNIFLSGRTKSCGCMNSIGEVTIINILKECDIDFICQYIFNNCRSDNGRVLRFDFYLPDYNCCIEYDGEQHFVYRNHGWNTEDYFKETKRRDAIKNEYCKNNGIKLIRIPYTDFNKLNKDYLIDLINK